MSFDFEAAVGAPFRMQPGLRRMRPGSLHLTPSAAAQVRAHEPTTLRSARLLRAKLAVLAAHPWQALLARTGFDASPGLDALACPPRGSRKVAKPHFLESDGVVQYRALTAVRTGLLEWLARRAGLTGRSS